MLRVGSTGNNEDSPTTLRNSKVSGIKNPPCHAIPAPDHFIDESGEIPSAIAAKESGYVLQDDPSRLDRFCNSEELKSEN